MLKYFIGFLTGALAGVIVAAPAPTPSGFSAITLTHHDAAGHTQHAVARLNHPYTWDSNGLSVDYTSDQLFCSAFSP